jgi:hypothetical protein
MHVDAVPAPDTIQTAGATLTRFASVARLAIGASDAATARSKPSRMETIGAVPAAKAAKTISASLAVYTISAID